MEIVSHNHVTEFDLIIGGVEASPMKGDFILDGAVGAGLRGFETEVGVDQAFPHPVAFLLLNLSNPTSQLIQLTVGHHLIIHMNIILHIEIGPDDVMGLSVMRVEDADDGKFTLFLTIFFVGEILQVDISEVLVDDATKVEELSVNTCLTLFLVQSLFIGFDVFFGKDGLLWISEVFS